MSGDTYAVIMAGGGGTRLWPLSRQTRPKQMLRLFGERTLFQIAVDRLEGVFPPERILVVTVADQAPALQVQCPQIPVENYLLEPAPRGTASVVGLAAVVLARRDPQAVMAVLTSDHFIEDEARFRKCLTAAMQVARDRFLVTLGITPTHPATGYGYIQMGSRLGSYQGWEAHHVVRFKEKPDQDTAQRLLAQGDHVWNSGMFFWQVDCILEEFERQMPALYQGLQKIREAWDTPRADEVLQTVWMSLEPQTIDFGIMENAQKVAVIPAEGLGWSDVGSWDALIDLLPGDAEGNIFVNTAGQLNLGAKNSLFYLGAEQRLVVSIGVEDLVVVDTGDVILICRRDGAQKVRQAVQQLARTGRVQYL